MCCILLKFYIKPQLNLFNNIFYTSCILLKFYIKPQLDYFHIFNCSRCILLKFYIKPQPAWRAVVVSYVVSY